MFVKRVNLVIPLPLPSHQHRRLHAMVSDIVNHRQSKKKSTETHTFTHINVFQISAFFTHAHPYKYTNVSKPAQLKVNTPEHCTSLIRQFGGKKTFPFYLRKSTHFHLRKRELICLQWLSLCSVKLWVSTWRQNKYIYATLWRDGEGSHGQKIRRSGEDQECDQVVWIQDFLWL